MWLNPLWLLPCLISNIRDSPQSWNPSVFLPSRRNPAHVKNRANVISWVSALSTWPCMRWEIEWGEKNLLHTQLFPSLDSVLLLRLSKSIALCSMALLLLVTTLLWIAVSPSGVRISDSLLMTLAAPFDLQSLLSSNDDLELSEMSLLRHAVCLELSAHSSTLVEFLRLITADSMLTLPY